MPESGINYNFNTHSKLITMLVFLTNVPTRGSTKWFQSVKLSRDGVHAMLKLNNNFNWEGECWFCQSHNTRYVSMHRVVSELDGITAMLVPITSPLMTRAPALYSWMRNIRTIRCGRALLTRLRHMQHCTDTRALFRDCADPIINGDHFNLCDVVIPILERRLLDLLPGCSITDVITELYPGSSASKRDDCAD